MASVYAECDVRRHGSGGVAAPRAEDDVQILLRHASGSRSTLVAGLASPAAGPRFLVQGSVAGLRIEGFDVQEAHLKAGASPESLGDRWGAEPDRTAALTRPDGTVTTLPLDRGRWDTFYPAVAAAVRGQGPLPVEPADAVAVARVLDAARRSAATGAIVTVRDGRPPAPRLRETH